MEAATFLAGQPVHASTIMVGLTLAASRTPPHQDHCPSGEHDRPRAASGTYTVTRRTTAILQGLGDELYLHITLSLSPVR